MVCGEVASPHYRTLAGSILVNLRAVPISFSIENRIHQRMYMLYAYITRHKTSRAGCAI